MCHGSDRCDRELFTSSCHPDAILSVGPFVGTVDELYEWSAGLQARYRTTMHTVENFRCEIDGDTAHAETYYLFVGCIGEETNLFTGGRYIDRFERRGDVWRIAARTNLIEWTSPLPALANPMGDVPGLDRNGLSARDRSDPSYIRPLINRRTRHVPRG